MRSAISRLDLSRGRIFWACNKVSLPHPHHFPAPKRPSDLAVLFLAARAMVVFLRCCAVMQLWFPQLYRHLVDLEPLDRRRIATRTTDRRRSRRVTRVRPLPTAAS